MHLARPTEDLGIDSILVSFKKVNPDYIECTIMHVSNTPKFLCVLFGPLNSSPSNLATKISSIISLYSFYGLAIPSTIQKSYFCAKILCEVVTS